MVASSPLPSPGLSQQAQAQVSVGVMANQIPEFNPVVWQSLALYGHPVSNSLLSSKVYEPDDTVRFCLLQGLLQPDIFLLCDLEAACSSPSLSQGREKDRDQRAPPGETSSCASTSSFGLGA